MKLLFKQDYYYSKLNKNYTAGEIAELDDKTVKKLINFGIAEACKEENTPKEIKHKEKLKLRCKLIYPGKVAPGNYWFINDDGEAFIKEKIDLNAQKVEMQKDFNFQAVNDKTINFKRGDVVYLTEGQFIAMKNLGYI